MEDEENEEPGSDDEKVVKNTDWKPTAQQLRDIKIAHDDAGCPTNSGFARLLRRGNAKPELAKWVRHRFKCK